MTTAEEARNRTLNAIKEKYKEELEQVEALIDLACDKLQRETTVSFEDKETMNYVGIYLAALGYEAWGQGNKLTIIWQEKKNYDDMVERRPFQSNIQ